MGIQTRGFHPAIYAMRASMALREELAEQRWQETKKIQENQQLKKSYWLQRMSCAMSALRAADPLGWQAWFDSDAVPDERFSVMAPIVEERVRSLTGRRIRATARLYRGVFIWRDQNGYFIFDESQRIYEFIDEAEARGHIDATLAMCGKLLGALA